MRFDVKRSSKKLIEKYHESIIIKIFSHNLPTHKWLNTPSALIMKTKAAQPSAVPANRRFSIRPKMNAKIRRVVSFRDDITWILVYFFLCDEYCKDIESIFSVTNMFGIVLNCSNFESFILKIESFLVSHRWKVFQLHFVPFILPCSPASVSQRQSVGLGIERCRVRNSLVRSVFFP